MSTRRSLLRGAAALALAAAIIGTGTLAPVASASPLDGLDLADTVQSTMNKPNVDGLPEIPGLGEVPGLGEIPGLNNVGSGGTDVGDIPIIGDVANTFKDAEPEEIVTGAIQFAGVAADTIVPLIRGLASK
jgi:hypothetical protein